MQNSIATLKNLAQDKTILLVEDDEQIIKSLNRLLSIFFTDIYQALNVQDAVTIYKKLIIEDAPVVVITDINLGEKTGIDLTYAIKEINQNQKVIAISGTEDRNIFIELIKCGFDSFVLKPIKEDELFKSLISTLEKIDYDLKLQESQKLLEDSEEYAFKLLKEQDQFLKNAIHEIHTPLAVIITNIDLLRIKGIKDDSLTSIEAGARIIQSSYEDMTYLMRHDRVPNIKTHIEPVNFIAERINYFTCIAEMNDLSFSMRVGQPNLPNLHISELKLARIVDNTLSNAIKYSNKPSEINVTVGLQHGNIFFEVRNHGPVINEKEKIFDRFYREAEQKGGYGLGLNIVAQICQEENVKVEVSSTPVRGTAFRYIFENEIDLRQQ